MCFIKNQETTQPERDWSAWHTAASQDLFQGFCMYRVLGFIKVDLTLLLKKGALFHFWKEADGKAMHTMERIQTVLAKYIWIWVLMTEQKHKIFKRTHLTMCVLASQKHRLGAQNKSTWRHCKAANHLYLVLIGTLKSDRGTVTEGKRANDIAWHCTHACTPSLTAEFGASNVITVTVSGSVSLNLCGNSHENTPSHSSTVKDTHAGLIPRWLAQGAEKELTGLVKLKGQIN